MFVERLNLPDDHSLSFIFNDTLSYFVQVHVVLTQNPRGYYLYCFNSFCFCSIYVLDYCYVFDRIQQLDYQGEDRQGLHRISLQKLSFACGKTAHQK